MDEKATIANLKDSVRTFCEERDWDQFHGPKDLAIGLITEASELLEHFRFRSDEEISTRLKGTIELREIEEEVADVFFFLLRFAQRCNIDLDDALRAKILKNAERYPAEKSRGQNLKYTEL